MLIWKGYGFTIPLIAFLISYLLQSVFDAVFFNGFYSVQKWPASLALFISAVPVWFLGKYLNKNAERIFLDPKTCREIKVASIHSLFWIRVEYWAPILCIIAIISLIKISEII
ncbi:MAG: hypothetical protein K0R78_229 [Pelosinus sp.]|jgi:hypothetical protein|nr:hypothetical protein [Pelosinus sp.]